MLEKFLSRFIAIFIYVCSFMFFLAFIGSLAEGFFHEIVSVIFLLISVVLILIGKKLWNITKPISYKTNANTIINQREDASVNPNRTTDVPPEILNDMRKSYSQIQLENDLRILQDSIDLMKTTKNIETFMHRSDLAHRTVLTIEQAMAAGIRVKENFMSSKDVAALKYRLLPELLLDSYEEMKIDAFKLKTAKGKIGRFQKYLDLLQEYEDELDISENYYDILESVKNDISQLTLTNNS